MATSIFLPENELMKKLLNLTLLAVAAASPAFAEPPSKDYELLFADEFDGTALNEAHWGYRVDVRKGGYFNGLNLKENVTVSDGKLRITARLENIKGKPEYTGGGHHQQGPVRLRIL